MMSNLIKPSLASTLSEFSPLILCPDSSVFSILVSPGSIGTIPILGSPSMYVTISIEVRSHIRSKERLKY